MNFIMTEGGKRREGILSLLEDTNMPLSGTELARHFNVSRQVIVQDIALLRAEDQKILSTYRGYVLEKDQVKKKKYIRVFCVCHSTEDTRDELQTIVDYGGHVLDVAVDHPLYGQIRADLIINNRLDVEEFVERMDRYKAQPLKVLTGDYHYHTVTAESEKNLDFIEQELRKKGYLKKSKGNKKSTDIVRILRRRPISHYIVGRAPFFNQVQHNWSNLRMLLTH